MKKGLKFSVMTVFLIMLLGFAVMFIGTEQACAETYTDEQGIKYDYNDSNNTARVDRNQNTSITGDVRIPSTITVNGTDYSVIAIDERAFSGCTKLSSIDMPASLTSIGGNAFYGCTNLSSITFPQGSQLTTIAGNAFSGCTNLSSIDMPASLTSIGGYAFNDCASLNSITFPQGSQLTTIAGYAFNVCTNLSSIDMPASLTIIGDGAFTSCTSLNSITFPQGSQLTTIAGNAFNGCTNLSSIDMPASLTSIAGYAFSGCTNLSNISIPASLTTIGGYAFNGCDALETIFFYCGTEQQWKDLTEGKYTRIKDNAKVIYHLPLTEHEGKPVTCTESGTEASWSCENCKKLFSDDEGKIEIDKPVVVPATGHKYGVWIKLNATQHQKVCEHDKSHVVKENHKWDSGKVTKKATEKATGVRTYTCTVCKATKTETIPKLKPSTPKVSGTPLAKATVKNKSMTIGWNKIQGAEGYDVFFALCNHNKKEIKCKKVKTIKGNKTFKWTKSGLKKGTAYKFYVRAYVTKNGKKTYVSKTPMFHAYTGNGTKNYTNAKSVTVNKTKVTLKKGKTFKIKAKVNKVKKNKKLMPKSHAPTLRYMTTNKKVATVNSSGKITAKGKGTCYIYTFAHNGVSKQIKVTVK